MKFITLFDEGSELSDVAVFLRQSRLCGCEDLFLLLVLDTKQFVVVCVGAWCLVADDGLHVLILRLLLQVLELEVAQEGLSCSKPACKHRDRDEGRRA